jgi:hypothetical protein
MAANRPQTLIRLDVSVGSNATEMGCPRYVRFPPNSDRRTDVAGCLKRATSGLMRCSKQPLHSITSSARPSNEGGTVSPRALAVLRLITSSNFTGSSIGKSAGFSPFKTFCT